MSSWQEKLLEHTCQRSHSSRIRNWAINTATMPTCLCSFAEASGSSEQMHPVQSVHALLKYMILPSLLFLYLYWPWPGLHSACVTGGYAVKLPIPGSICFRGNSLQAPRRSLVCWTVHVLMKEITPYAPPATGDAAPSASVGSFSDGDSARNLPAFARASFPVQHRNITAQRVIELVR
eukprot:COSAG02_NODE_21_length_53083_cov_95.733618_34_plen_178_part_00